MILYTFHDPSAPHGERAFTSERAARAERAKRFRRRDRPELFRVDIGVPTHQRICEVFTGAGHVELMEDIG